MDLNQLLQLAGDSEPYAEHLTETTPDVRKRVRALKKLQIESFKVEAEFYKRIEQLQIEFQPRYDAVNTKRAAIIAGTHEPVEEECKVPLLSNMPEAELKELEEQWDNGNATKESVTGIPKFWLDTLRQVSGINDLIQDHDVKILEHLVDIKNIMEDNSFTLEFHFSPNEYFSNEVLSKTYATSNEINEEDPFDYEGPYVVGAKGTEIQWKGGNQVPLAHSVFGFFYPQVTSIPKDADSDEHDAMIDILREDFSLGQIIRDQVIPRAVLYYTGEIDDQDGFDPESMMEDSFEDEDMDD